MEWSSDTVDNEHLGRRSSKCECGGGWQAPQGRGAVTFNPCRCLSGCCIYEKPRQFGESSSESEGDEDEEGCGSANCILGHSRRGHGQTAGGAPAAPPSSGAAHGH